ncbi:molybdate ABC transporter permease subunit [Rhodanobacter sp. MP7CTX1]|jgi:molybdate transport system permease protein|uniref:molybdate ABC transporter permease subunit n=1 Tax=Rhodanobacter sp. MP7CTX1 TaxID=2723084 RepID=UPI0017BE25CD|nr:molybdate ABC transporter permease subunit [Rhodanobacter sp. MP7CTX1]MBB6186142.1 molybdate transport system permease protein [Rhodanobacter sp. MP7CTX1]
MMPLLSTQDLQAFGLTLRLAATVTAMLLLLGTPLAWWLAQTRSRWQRPVAAVVALPLVLPPTVLGFYLLLLLGPHGAVGRLIAAMGLSALPFTFGGLVVGSVLYSLPFVVQPLHNAFEAIGVRPLEVAACLRASPFDRFFSIACPMALPGFITAAVLGFAHTMGEFGVVLMIGGNIPGQTRVLSMRIFDHVEAGEYSQAHTLSLCLLVFSFAALLAMSLLRPRRHERG